MALETTTKAKDTDGEESSSAGDFHYFEGRQGAIGLDLRCSRNAPLQVLLSVPISSR